MNQEQINKIASMFEEIGKHLVTAGKEAAELAVTAVYYQSLTNMIVGAGCVFLATIALYFCYKGLRWGIKQDGPESFVMIMVFIVMELRGLYLVQSSLLGVLSPKSALVIKILEKFGM